MTGFCYNSLMPTPNLQRLLMIAALAGMLMPAAAIGYFSPEEVLLNKQLFLPPREGDESKDRVKSQQEFSAQRRLRDQQEAFAIQHPAPAEEALDAEQLPGDVWTEGASNQLLPLPAGLSATDLELLRTIRLLDRITEQQRVLQYGVRSDGTIAHGGAPLAPTGAGAWVAATTVIGAVLWTLRRARAAERSVWSFTQS
jgi:hypothetical protein